MNPDRLREAARVLRERAEAADNGPWKSDSSIEGDTIVYPATGGWLSNVTSPRVYEGGVVCFDHERANGDYIAAMHPGVGLALADWLDASTPFSARGHIRPEAIAVADQILGGVS